MAPQQEQGQHLLSSIVLAKVLSPGTGHSQCDYAIMRNLVLPSSHFWPKVHFSKSWVWFQKSTNAKQYMNVHALT